MAFKLIIIILLFSIISANARKIHELELTVDNPEVIKFTKIAVEKFKNSRFFGDQAQDAQRFDRDGRVGMSELVNTVTNLQIEKAKVKVIDNTRKYIIYFKISTKHDGYYGIFKIYTGTKYRVFHCIAFAQTPSESINYQCVMDYRNKKKEEYPKIDAEMTKLFNED